MIEAAGGVVWRQTSRGRIEVVVVHRPRCGSWSLPKGKLERRESPLAAALREVEEETGLRCEAGPELEAVQYRDRRGRKKRVRYWAMRPIHGSFAPSREVDEMRWLRLDEASSLLGSPLDLDVLVSLGARTTTVA